MKRPLFFVGTACFTTLAVVFYGGFSPVLFVGATLCLAVGLVLLSLKKSAQAVAIKSNFICCYVGVLLAGLLFWQYNFFRMRPLEELSGKTVEMSGVVTEVLTNTRVPVYELYGDLSFEGATYKNYTATFSDYGENTLKVGERVRFSAKIALSDSSTFYGSYNITMGQLLGGYIKGTATPLPGNKYAARAAVSVFRSKLIASIYRLDGEPTADILTALLTGDRDGITSDLNTSLGYSGLAHVVAVSGLHLSVVLYFVSQLLKQTYIPLKARYILEIVVAWAVAALTGLGYPVVRSAVMLTILRLGLVFGKNSDTLNSLGFSALLICAFNPYAAGSVSFQATYLATLFIVTLAPKMERALVKKDFAKRFNAHLKAALTYFIKLTIVGICSLTGTSLIFYFIYGYVSLNSLISSALVVPLLPAILGFGYLAALLGMVPFLRGLAKVLYAPAKLMLRFFMGSAKRFATLPFMFFVNDNFVYLWLAVFLLAAAVLIYKNHKNPFGKLLIKPFVTVAVVVLLVGQLSAQALGAGSRKICVFKDDDALILINGHSAAVIGLPTNTNIDRQFRRYGITTVEVFILPSDSFVANNAAARFIQKYRPETVVAPLGAVVQSYLRSTSNTTPQLLSEYEVYFYEDKITLQDDFVVIESSSAVVVKSVGQVAVLPPTNVSFVHIGEGNRTEYAQQVYLRRTPFSYYEILIK